MFKEVKNVEDTDFYKIIKIGRRLDYLLRYLSYRIARAFIIIHIVLIYRTFKYIIFLDFYENNEDTWYLYNEKKYRILLSNLNKKYIKFYFYINYYFFNDLKKFIKNLDFVRIFIKNKVPLYINTYLDFVCIDRNTLKKIVRVSIERWRKKHRNISQYLKYKKDKKDKFR